MKLFCFTLHLLLQILVFHVGESYASDAEGAEDHEKPVERDINIGNYMSDWEKENSSSHLNIYQSNNKAPDLHRPYSDYVPHIHDWDEEDSNTTKFSHKNIYQSDNEVPDLHRPYSDYHQYISGWEEENSNTRNFSQKIINQGNNKTNEFHISFPLQNILEYFLWMIDIPNRFLNTIIPNLGSHCPLRVILPCIRWIVDVPNRLLDILDVIIKVNDALHIFNCDIISNFIRLLRHLLALRNYFDAGRP